MSKKSISFILLFLFCSTLSIIAQETSQKSELHKQAESIDIKKDAAQARSLYLRAFSDYSNKGDAAQAVECAVKATQLYYRDNSYNEAFELLRNTDQAVVNIRVSDSERAKLFYQTAKERMKMYIKMKRQPGAKDQLDRLESLAGKANDESVNNDLLYNKAIFYYTFGQNAQGNAVFKEMASKLTAQKEYDKVDEVYKTLIANGRASGSAQLVAQSYDNYIAWKDSANAQKVADEINALKQQIADHEATIADKDSSLSSRQIIIIGLCILAAALAAALVIGAIVLLRFILLTRKQKKTIRIANDSNALKAKFISNISAQLEPTFRKLDNSQPEVKALLEFAAHIQTLSDLENNTDEEIELEETAIQPFCEQIINDIRDKVDPSITLTVNAPKMSANINKEYVSHILHHLLMNAIEFTPANGTITLDFKKRGPHTCQFMVSDTGESIPEEKREDVFKPFLEIRDLTTGDGLGLPICKQMALKMKGDLDIDPQFTKGTRFVLELHG